MSLCFLLASAGPSDVESSFDIIKVFQSCPIIYSILLFLSLAAFVVWLYSLLTLRLTNMMPKEFIHHVRQQLMEGHFEEALAFCRQEKNFASNIISCGIAARKHGSQVMINAMQSEGRRCGNSLWQRISLLNEISVIAPMLGLLGTVLGLFLAFYNTNQTAESFASIFDGLGVAVGTTVVGLVVAILSMIFYTTLKYHVVNLLNSIENETLALMSIVEVDETR